MIVFNKKELEIIHNTDFLITKISVFKKLHVIFEKVRETQKEVINSSSLNFPSNVDLEIGKIFKGENYNSLPYMVLDYPKYYSNTDTFSFRTMFLWGHYYSSTLHLSGKSFEKFRDNIKLNIEEFVERNNEIYICVNKSQWEYHYHNDNYVSLNKENLDLINELEFLKLSTKYPLNDYNNIPTISAMFLEKVLKLLE